MSKFRELELTPASLLEANDDHTINQSDLNKGVTISIPFNPELKTGDIIRVRLASGNENDVWKEEEFPITSESADTLHKFQAFFVTFKMLVVSYVHLPTGSKAAISIYRVLEAK